MHIVMKITERTVVVSYLQSSFCTTDPRMTRQFSRATFLSDYRADLPKLEVPALILRCSEDAVAPDAVGRFLNEALKGSTFRQMAATGHCPHMSHPAETIAL